MTNLREKLEIHLKESGFSQEGISKSLGVSGSAISSWRKGTYAGDNERIDNLVDAYLKRYENITEKSKGIKMDFDFVPTTVYKNVIKGAELAQVRHCIRVEIGESGVGKTTALEHLKADNESIILLKAYPGIRKNRVLAKLCKAAGFNCRGSYDDLFEELSTRLDGANRLIAIDECEHLPIDAIDAIRRINDFTLCPVIFVGLPNFYQILIKYQIEYAYVFNRISIPINVGRNSREDAGEMVSTMLDCDVDSAVWHDACNGIGRDLKEIVLESVRIAELNKIDMKDTDRFIKVIKRVKKELGRN